MMPVSQYNNTNTVFSNMQFLNKKLRLDIILCIPAKKVIVVRSLKKTAHKVVYMYLLVPTADGL
jgi:hypothetical protein